MNAWIGAHNRRFKSTLEEVHRLLFRIILKLPLPASTLKELVLNPTYREMCDHYGILCMPARVRAPRDKASVEGSVSTISTWIIAALRNEHCFTLNDLNQKVVLKLEEFNHRDFSKRERHSVLQRLKKRRNSHFPSSSKTIQNGRVENR